jgi:hypothetical protein
MESGPQFLTEQPVDEPVTGDRLFPGELLADDDELEVGLGARGDAVHVALVDHLKVEGREGLFNLRLDALAATHAATSLLLAPAARGGVVRGSSQYRQIPANIC